MPPVINFLNHYNQMTKAELISKMAADAEVTKVQATAALNSLLEA